MAGLVWPLASLAYDIVGRTAGCLRDAVRHPVFVKSSALQTLLSQRLSTACFLKIPDNRRGRTVHNLQRPVAIRTISTDPGRASQNRALVEKRHAR
jgi:hypothetical protein